MVKKKKEENINKEIKKMESAKREKLINKPVNKKIEPSKIPFDTWFFMRCQSIPKQHAREIIIVDFKARGLKNEETVDAFDKALSEYGVKL